MKAAVITTGPGVEQAHGDGIEELALGQPVMLGDDPVAQQRHDRQPGPEHQGAGLKEEQSERDQDPASGGGADRGYGQRHAAAGRRGFAGVRRGARAAGQAHGRAGHRA